MNIISYCWVDSYPDRDMGLSSREERGWSDKRTQARMSGERAASALNIQIRTMQQTCRQIRHSRSRSAASATARHFPLDPNKSNPLLIKPLLGCVKATVYDLPSFCHAVVRLMESNKQRCGSNRKSALRERTRPQKRGPREMASST